MFPVGTKAARTWREQILANLHWPMCQVLHHNVNVSDFMLDVLNICSVTLLVIVICTVMVGGCVYMAEFTNSFSVWLFSTVAVCSAFLTTGAQTQEEFT